MTGRDGRSVGEILLEADHTARELLMDAPDLNAAVVLRTWGGRWCRPPPNCGRSSRTDLPPQADHPCRTART